MKQLRNGAGWHMPQHYSGTQSSSGRVLSHARSLTAAVLAVAMMASVAVTAVLPAYDAEADENNLVNGAACIPTAVSLGTGTSGGTVDTGIATYVGGDMYIGQKSSGNMNNVDGPSGSYAAEAEGLTAVNGKLLMHPLKGLWTEYYTSGSQNGHVKDYRGFRFGIVGFGGQYRPATGSSTLEVKGNSSDSDISWVSGAKAWGNAGWVAAQSTNSNESEPVYSANINGQTGTESTHTVYGGSSNPVPGNGSQSANRFDSRDSIYVPSGMNGSVSWNKADDAIGSTGETFTGFGNYISDLSSNLKKLSDPAQKPDTVYVADATVSNEYGSNWNNLARTKFDGFYSFTINNVNEKVIEFKGDGTSSMQVFNLPASMLSDSGYTGIDFAFKNIPDTSSVVINVTGEKVDFHNGWRFWWTDMSNQKVELGGSYTDTAYAKRAQQIMWNFADASSVIIRGGQGTGITKRLDANGNVYAGTTQEQNDKAWGNSFDITTNDDPAAGFLGSILVPNGSFESHVSTNGRVWVGKSFAMYNPTAVTNAQGEKFVNYERSYSASALDMDQERHNLPWNGSYSTSCAAIAWDKVDESGTALDGTSWTVYGTKNDAVQGTNAIASVADGGWNDGNAAGGSFKLGNLAKNGTYFLKESGTVEGYTQNGNIYQINTGSTTEAATAIVSVFDASGTVITNNADADTLLSNGKIVNKKMGSAIEWQKVDGTDNSTLLAGSTWTLSKMNGDAAEQTWTIADDQSGTKVERIAIADASGNAITSDTTIALSGNATQRFTATAYDQSGQQITGAKLTWTSGDAQIASVSEDGTVTPTGNGNTTITVKSADGTVSASFNVAVTDVTVSTSIAIQGYADAAEISLEKGKTLDLTAKVKPEDNSVEWSTSSPDDVSLSANAGTSVTLTARRVTATPVTITAKETRTNKTVTLKVNVTAKQYLTLYFQAQTDWPVSNVKVHYRTKSNARVDINMDQMYGSCSNYAYADIPLTGDKAIDATSQFGFQYISGDTTKWYGASGSSNDVPKEGNNFKFTNGSTLPEVVVISAGPSYSTVAPSGCAVTSTAAYRSRRVTVRNGEHRAVAAVLRTQGSMLNAANETEATGTESAKADEDTAAGKFKVSDLADGTYHLQEKTAPNGYEVSSTVYVITIDNGTATWSPDVTDSKIANTRKAGSVKWAKVSSNNANSSPLPGSEWTLKQTKTFSWENGVAKYTDVTPGTTLGTVADCVDGKNNVTNCATQTGEYVDLDGTAGKLQISGLDWGEYELVESKAPDGYNLDTTPHTFRIGPLEGDTITGDWYANTNFNTEGKSAYGDASLTVDGGNIKNQPGAMLPGTGGAGDYWMYAAALATASIGVVAAGMALKVRRRQ